MKLPSRIESMIAPVRRKPSIGLISGGKVGARVGIGVGGTGVTVTKGEFVGLGLTRETGCLMLSVLSIGHPTHARKDRFNITNTTTIGKIILFVCFGELLILV